MNTNQIIVLATSAPPSRPGYRRDLLEALCHSDGTLVRFTYRKKWIEEELLTNNSKESKQALIVFCDLPKQEDGDFALFLPLRYVNSLSFEPVGLTNKTNPDDYITVSFTLGSFVNCGSSKIEDKVNVWQQWLLSQDGKYPRPMKHPESEKGKFVFIAQDFIEDEIEDQSSSWLKLTDMLSSSETLRGSVFYRIEGLFESHQRAKQEPIPSTPYMGQPAWYLKSGKHYRLDLQFYLDPSRSAPPPTLAPRSSTKSIVLSQPIWRSIGLGRDATIFLRSETVFSDEVASLVIEDPQDTEAKSAQAQFLLVIKPARGLLITAVVLVAIGTAMTAISSDLIKSLANQGSFMYLYAQNIAIASKAIATALVAFGVYLSRR